MDPQQRLLLEVCWEALENAGIPADSLQGTDAGVFVGMMPSDYAPRWFESPGSYDGALGMGTSSSFGSGRIAYLLGLHGPAITLDTACSSSLVAMHVASQAVQQRECDVAIVGGVTVMSSPANLVEFGRNGLLASDGRCKAFSAAADGVGLSEGAGVLILQRLDDARRLGRQVLAVIEASAVTQDGASNGMTAPNGRAQQRVIRRALYASGLRAADVDVVEAHGTGTVLGDSIEARSILDTYGSGREADRPVWLGSVKSNVGHTQAAAGITSVIKMVLSLQHEALAPSVHAQPANAETDRSGTVRLLTEVVPWPRSQRQRRAGISAFGLSGTNAHLILAEPLAGTDPDAPAPRDPEPASRASNGGSLPWLLSARSRAALAAMAGNLHSALDARSEVRAEDIGNRLVKTRAVLPHRAAVMPDPRGDYRAGLAALTTGAESPHVAAGTSLPVVRTAFVIAGGAAPGWAATAARLMAESTVFAAKIRECEQAVSPYLQGPLSAALPDAPDGSSPERAEVARAVMFAVTVALAALWRHHGIEPDAVLGHAEGEIAAAYLAGDRSLPDAARLVAPRTAHPPSRSTDPVAAGSIPEDSTIPEGPGTPASRLPRYSTATGALADSVEAMLADGYRLFIEIGHDPMLSDTIGRAAAAAGVDARVVATPHSADGGQRSFMRSLTEAYVCGATVDWNVVFGTQSPPAGPPLPTYPFQRQRFWLEPPAPDEPPVDAHAAVPSGPGGPPGPERGPAAELAALPPAQRKDALLSLVREAIATILEVDDRFSMQPDETFENLGLASLAAIDVRGVLAERLDLALPVTVVLDHARPADLVAYLDQFLLNETAQAPPAAEREDAITPASGPRSGGSGLPGDIESLYRLLSARGDSKAAWDMVAAVAGLREVFSADNGPEPVTVTSTQLAAGDQQPVLVCFPSVVSLAGPAEYGNLAAEFSGVRDVLCLGEPGFRDGEPLPADLSALVEAYARTLRRLVPAESAVLCGRSFGGWLAHATAQRLADSGHPPAGLVLLDTFWPGEEFTRKFVPRTLRRLVDRQNDLDTELGITRLTGIGWYLRLLAQWRPERSPAPTLCVNPEEQTPVELHLRRAGWQLPHTLSEVAADHFTILDSDANAAADAIEAWLRRHAERAS